MSWLVAAACSGVVVGIIVAPYFNDLRFGHYSWFLVGLALLGIGVWQARIYACLFMVLAGGLLGLWRSAPGLTELRPFAGLLGHTITVSGVVKEDADIGEKGDLRLRLETTSVDGHALRGKLWVSASTGRDIRRSDKVTLTGRLSEGFGNFAGSIYRAEIIKVERPVPGDVALRLRDSFSERVRLAIAEPAASLGTGFLLGQRRALPPEIDEALMRTGLTHIVVASGYNLMILVRLSRRLFEKVSKYLSVFVAGGLIVAFVAITGLSPSMSRAGLVAGLGLAAWYYGRRFHPLVILPLAAAITLLVDPSYGWNDLGWQLSFATFAGVMIVAPLLNRYFFGEKRPSFVRQLLSETIAAQLMALPILAASFGTIQVLAPIVNLIVLPFVPLAMLLTFVAGCIGLVWPSVAEYGGWPAELLLNAILKVVGIFSDLPFAQVEVSPDSWLALAASAIIGLGIFHMWRQTRPDLRALSQVE